MKIKMKDNAEYRISSAKSQTFLKGREYDNVPKATAEALVSAGKAEEVLGSKPANKE